MTFSIVTVLCDHDLYAVSKTLSSLQNKVSYPLSLEKAMAVHSSTLACKVPWTEEPGSLQSMGSQRVGHDWATLLYLPLMPGFPVGSDGKESACQCQAHKRCGLDPWVSKMPWRRKWQPTPVFLPGELHGPEEPGGLWPIESQRVRHDWSDLGKESEVAQLCPTLCDPMDCRLPGSSIHGIFQARILEWVAISFLSWWAMPSSVQFSSVSQLCLNLYNPMNLSTPGLPIHHQFPEFT